MGDRYLYYGGLGRAERQYSTQEFIGLSLSPQHDREIKHNALDPLPFDDCSIAKIQSQDVFEHLPYEKLPFVLDEAYRVLKVGGLFRLSIPDYRSPLLKRRSIYDSTGQILGDLMMGATAAYDPTSTAVKVAFTSDGDSHVWFPRYELALDLIVKSNIRKSTTITFYQCFIDDSNFLCKPIPDEEMPVTRSFPNDARSNGEPISIVIDFLK